MADICEFTIEVRCPEPQATEIREAIEAALEVVEGSAFGFILQSHHLSEYPAWDGQWSGIGGPGYYADGALCIGGSCKWGAPVWLANYLSHHYRVPIVMHATIANEEHEEWRINLLDPTHPNPILKWESYNRETRYPMRRYSYREGRPTSTSTAGTKVDCEQLEQIEASAIHALLPPDFLGGLPEARPEWLSGAGLDSTRVLGRYYGSFERRTLLDAESSRPTLEYFVLGRFGTSLLAVRQWNEDVSLVKLDEDMLIHAHPTLARDRDWTPQTWGSIRAKWLVDGFGGRLPDKLRLDQNLLDGTGESTLAEEAKNPSEGG